MMSSIRGRRLRFALLLCAAPLVLPACSDSPTEQGEPEIGSVRLTAGGQTVVITPGGAQGTMTLNGSATNVTATFFDNQGDPLTLDADEFEIRLVPANAGVLTFTRQSAFSGTLHRVAAGSTLVAVSVFHLLEGHPDFGPHNVGVTVQ
jgi:hypothetical protein